MSAAALYPQAPCSYSRPAPQRRKERSPRGRPRYAEPSVRRGCSIEQRLDEMLEADRAELGISRTEQYRLALYLYLFHRHGGLMFSVRKTPPQPSVEALAPPVVALPAGARPLEEERGERPCGRTTPEPPAPVVRSWPSGVARPEGGEVVIADLPRRAPPEESMLLHQRVPETEALPTDSPPTRGSLACDISRIATSAPVQEAPAPAVKTCGSTSRAVVEEDAREDGEASDPDGWLTRMIERHATRLPEGESAEMFYAEYPHLRFVSCEARDCTRRAALTYEGKRYCQEHGNLLQEVERRVVEAVTEPAPSPVVEAPLPPDCDVCQNLRFQLKDQGGKVAAVTCSSCDLPCQVCQGRGEVLGEYRGYTGWLECRCKKYERERIEKFVTWAELPATYLGLLFGDLPTPPKPLSESQQKAHLLASTWAKEYDPKHRPRQGFFFYGSPGTGKTLSLCRILAHLSTRKLRCKYVHFPLYLDTRKQQFAGKALRDGSANCIQDLASVDVLLVDEILFCDRKGRKRSFTDWERHQLDLLVHERYNEGRPTLYSTNHPPDTIEDEVAESTWSRILATSTFLEVRGPDLRQQPKSRRPSSTHPWRRPTTRRREDE